MKNYRGNVHRKSLVTPGSLKETRLNGILRPFPRTAYDSRRDQEAAPNTCYRLPAIIWAACCRLVSVTFAPESMRATS